MAKNNHQDFTLGLAIVDLLPVLFFSLSFLYLGYLYKSILFLAGSIVVALSGLMKASWKFVIVLKQRDVRFLNRQLRYLMPVGFILILISLFTNHASMSTIIHALTSYPSVLFFVLTIILMGLMFVFAFRMDHSSLKANWIEQTVNTLAQLSLLIGLLLL